MAATRIRLAGSNDYGDTAYWSGTTLPADTDDARFEVGGDTITLNLSQPGIDLNLLYFGPTSRYNVGAEGSPLIIDANNGGAGKVEILGLHDYIYLQAGTGGTYPIVTHKPANPSAKLVVTTSVITTLYQINGQLFLRGTVTGTTANLEGGFTTQDYASGTAFTTINVRGGQHVISRAFTTLNVYGGTVTLDDGNKGVTFGVVNQHGGEVIHINGNTGNYNGYAGTYNKSRLAKGTLTQGTFTALPTLKVINAKGGVDVTPVGTSYPAGSPDISTGSGAVI